ncbi:pyrroloquinoline quinone precursor peptide PqqA [Roseibium algae]|uniref:Coenzyme PQQ synthesis protein A n=1 Tax=Roseibium algae TaxID=3123038 RepID=A0ABU8TQ22_9HYPH
MKTWTKPAMTAVEAGFEVTRYMPAEIGTCSRKK